MAGRKALKAAALVLAVVYAAPGSGDTGGGIAGGAGWEFRGAAYLWMANINGDQTVKGQQADLDVGFGDVLDVLDFAAEAHVEALKDNTWGFFVDGTYLKLGPDAKQGPVRIGVNYEYWLMEAGGVYRAKTWSTGSGNAAVDLLLGGRFTSMDVDIDFLNVPVQGVSGDQSWVDLIAGARLVMDLPNDWSLVLRGDLGGFGIGDSSDLSAQGIVTGRWNFSPSWNLAIGYRALYQDYESGSGTNRFAYDATTHGPMLGIEYRF